MFPLRYLCLAFALLVCCEFARAQTVVNSTFVDHYPNPFYGDPNNWAPPEVPNNTALKQYNVNISPGFGVEVNTDATISNLTLTGQFTALRVTEKTLVVTGTTTNQLDSEGITVQTFSSGEAKFNAGTLSSFSNHTLSGSYSISSRDFPATLQFNGAAVSTLSNGYVGFFGPQAQMVDENGNDALLNVARVDSDATLSIADHSMVTNAPFSNEGSLSVSQIHMATTFTAAVSLTNFDLGTRTITGGNFAIGVSDPGIGPAELRFNGADIVNNGSVIQLIGASAKIADLAGNDGLRNLARTLPNAVLLLSQHDLTIPGQFQNDGSLVLVYKSIFAVAGALGNFDAVTRTFSGGSFEVGQETRLKFAGADIVHNGAHLSISQGGVITDLAGNDALRNFSDNLGTGEFIVGSSIEFTAPGDFTNSGRVETVWPLFTGQGGGAGRITVPSGFRYTQTAGETVNWGFLTAEHIDILGGSVSGGGHLVGDVLITDATITPSPDGVIDGSLTLSAGSHFHFSVYAEPLYEISGKVTLAGALEVDIPSEAFVSSTRLIAVVKSALPIAGTFSNAPNGSRIQTTDGKGSVQVVYDVKGIYVTGYQAEPAPAQLLNISSRAFLSRSDDDPFGDRTVIIGGFIITGSAQKEIVLRGLGPSLKKFGLDPVLADPVLELHASDGSVIANNDDWKANQAAITAAGLAPEDDREAALRITLVPGTYTAVIKEKTGQAGHGLVEIYDLSQNTTSKLANISTRGFTDSNNVLIGGIIVGGSGQANADVVVRALGPQLRRNGVLNALDDPTLEVRDGNGNLVGVNDDWLTNFNQMDSTGLAPLNNSESAMLLSLPGGRYTAVVRAKGNSGGVALVEFYDLRR